MRSSIGKTLSFLLLGACEGLTLTRDENIAVSQAGGAPAIIDAASYPLSAASGIDRHAPITFAYTMDATDEKLLANTGDITVSCTNCDTDEIGAPISRVLKFPAQDRQVHVMTTIPAGGGSTTITGYITIKPDIPWLVSTHTVAFAVDVFTSADPNGANVNLAAAVTAHTFVVQADCADVLTKTDCATRADCMWTGECENEVITVAGSLPPADGGSATAGTIAANNGAGIQYVADGVETAFAGAPKNDCAN